MLVSWATAANATPADYAAVVQYGPTPTTMTMRTAVADSRNYTLCSLPSPFLHKATMTGLVAGASYYYTIVEPRCTAPGAIQFLAPSVVGEGNFPFTVIAYGDMGITNSGPTAEFLAARVAAGAPPNVVTHAGDISYADNRGCPKYDSVQDIYYNEISPYASRSPVMFSSGNHEAFGSDVRGGFLAYRERVAPTMPIANSSATPFWYSFNAGRIHFLAFDIDQPWSAGSAQHDFIVSDLQSVDRSLTPIVYAFQHFPTFCSNYFWCMDKTGKPAAETAAFRALYEPIFNAPETRVHIYVSGHVHAAEVPFPVATGGLVPSQMDWLNMTTTFNAMLGFPGDEEVCCNDWVRPAPAYSAWRTDDVYSDGGTFGFGEFTFTSDTALTFRAWSAINQSVIFETNVTFSV